MMTYDALSSFGVDTKYLDRRNVLWRHFMENPIGADSALSGDDLPLEPVGAVPSVLATPQEPIDTAARIVPQAKGDTVKAPSSVEEFNFGVQGKAVIAVDAMIFAASSEGPVFNRTAYLNYVTALMDEKHDCCLIAATAAEKLSLQKEIAHLNASLGDKQLSHNLKVIMQSALHPDYCFDLFVTDRGDQFNDVLHLGIVPTGDLNFKRQVLQANTANSSAVTPYQTMGRTGTCGP